MIACPRDCKVSGSATKSMETLYIIPSAHAERRTVETFFKAVLRFEFSAIARNTSIGTRINSHQNVRIATPMISATIVEGPSNATAQLRNVLSPLMKSPNWKRSENPVVKAHTIVVTTGSVSHIPTFLPTITAMIVRKATFASSPTISSDMAGFRSVASSVFRSS